MRYDDEFINRMDLLQKYDFLMRQVNMKRIPFRLRRKLRRDCCELVKYYEEYKQAPLEKSYLTAANRAFSKKLSDFEEKLMEEEK